MVLVLSGALLLSFEPRFHFTRNPPHRRQVAHVHFRRRRAPFKRGGLACACELDASISPQPTNRLPTFPSRSSPPLAARLQSTLLLSALVLDEAACLTLLNGIIALVCNASVLTPVHLILDCNLLWSGDKMPTWFKKETFRKRFFFCFFSLQSSSPKCFQSCLGIA